MKIRDVVKGFPSYALLKVYEYQEFEPRCYYVPILETTLSMVSDDILDLNIFNKHIVSTTYIEVYIATRLHETS